jgi:hypothetical protein
MKKKPFLVNIEIELAIFAENEESIYNHPDLRKAVEEALYSSDSCIAFIRYEDEKRPIKEGDTLKIDQTTFPKKKNDIK